jgi:hypothetical protein
MKDKPIKILPKCDFCGEQATYDAPTKLGPWANMCEDCYNINGVGTLGTRFVQRTPNTSNKEQPVREAECDLDDFFDSVIELRCPACGEERSMEPDFHGRFTCEGCGQRLSFSNPMF